MRIKFSKHYLRSVLIFFCSLGLAFLSCQVYAAPLSEDDPIKMMQGISDLLVTGLKDHKNELKHNSKIIYDLVYSIVIPHIDNLAMMKLVLGRGGYQQWKESPAEKQQQFESILINLIIGTYVSALQSYDNEKATVYPPRDPIDNQKRVTLKSKIFTKDGQPVNITYVLTRVENSWKIIDLSVEGVSLVQSYRSQFSSLLAQGGLDNLITTLQEHNEKNKIK